MQAKGRKRWRSWDYRRKQVVVLENIQENEISFEYTMLMPFSSSINQHGAYGGDEGLYQCRVFNPASNVTIIQNVTLHVKNICTEDYCKTANTYCVEGIGDIEDAKCPCKDGYREGCKFSDRACHETCAVKICPDHSVCVDTTQESFGASCRCDDGYHKQDNVCIETCYSTGCPKFQSCKGYGVGECSCDADHPSHKGKCINKNIVTIIKDAILSYNQLMIHSVSFVDEMYQRILEDRMDIKNIYKLILSNHIPDYENQELSCFLNKTSNDGLAKNITSYLAPVNLMSKALHTGKHSLQKLFLNASFSETCNDLYTEIISKECGKNVCIKKFGPCLNFLDAPVEQWNSLIDELNMLIKNWKNAIIMDTKLKDLNIEDLVGGDHLNELQTKIQECAPSKQLASGNIKEKLSQYKLNLEFGKFEQYTMPQLEKRVDSLKNFNKKISEKVCEGFSHQTENCQENDILIDTSSITQTASPAVSEMLLGMAEKLKRYSEDNSIDNYFSLTDECESFEFKCSDGRCISPAFKCDKINHCPDGLDEDWSKTCTNPWNHICGNGNRISWSKVCDGSLDCDDGSDETHESCENHCPSPFHRIGAECLKVGNRDHSWHEAKRQCELSGLKLAQLHTKNYDLLYRAFGRREYWVDSYLSPTEGFTWPDTGLRIDGISDAYQRPRYSDDVEHPCLGISLPSYNKQWTTFFHKCSDTEPYLCEKNTLDVAETVPLSYFGAPDGFEWIGEHLVFVHGGGTVDFDTRMTYEKSLQWCQQENFKPFIPETVKQWEDMRWLLRKYQHNLQQPIWLPASDKDKDKKFTWYNDKDLSYEWIDYWQSKEQGYYNTRSPLDYNSNSSQCLSIYKYNVSPRDCNSTQVPMICEYTGDLSEAQVPIYEKKDFECGEILKTYTAKEIYLQGARGSKGATSHDKTKEPYDEYGYLRLPYLFWSSKENVDLLTQPEAWWYQFPFPITVIKFAFQPRQDGEDQEAEYAPSKYEIFASNSEVCNDTSTWETLFEDNSGTPFNNKSEVKMAIIENTKKFRCYGIKVTEVPNPRYVKISNMRIWVKDDDWFQVGGESFKVIDGDTKSWYSARSTCQCFGADLAQPDDSGYLSEYIKKHDIYSKIWSNPLAVGATDLSIEGGWKWLTGISIDDNDIDMEDSRNNWGKRCLALGFTRGRDDRRYLIPVYCYETSGGYYQTTPKSLCEKNNAQLSRQKHIIFGLRGEYFIVVKKALKWEEARKYCQALGGDLAMPSDIGLLRNYLFKNELIYDFWLGAVAENSWSRDTMKWLDGEKVDFENIPSEYIGEEGKYFDFQVMKYPSMSRNLRDPSVQYFICETAALMPEFVIAKGAPFTFDACGNPYMTEYRTCETRSHSTDCFSTRYHRCDGENKCDDGTDEMYCEVQEQNIYIKVGSENFLVKEDNETWDIAKRACSHYGGYLARPNDLLKLKNFLSENYSHLSYWIGGSDLQEEGTWVWDSSQTLIKSGWADGEPKSELDDQNCLVFNTDADHDKSLGAENCRNKKAFVCEYSIS